MSPLLKGKSKKDFSKNVSTEMDAGKPQKQSLAIAYSVKRRSGKKKMAKGGEITAKGEKRPMPDDTYDDSKETNRTGKSNMSGDQSWGGDQTVKQAQKASPTKLSQPKLRGDDAFSGRNKEMRDEENDLIDSDYPESDRAQPRERRNENGPNRQGSKVSDMSRQHNNGKTPYDSATENQYSEDMADEDMKKRQSPLGRYADGGEVEDPDEKSDGAGARNNGAKTSTTGNKTKTGGSNPGGASTGGAGTVTITTGNTPPSISVSDVGGRTDSRNAGGMDPSDEDDDATMMAEGGEVEEHYASIADAILAKKRRASAQNGRADVSLNAVEEPNNLDDDNYDALRKENYSESAGLDQLNSPEDSNTHGRTLSDEDEHGESLVDSIRRKRKNR
jgi:hypothetical protein